MYMLMYICIYVYMYLYIYICMHACIYTDICHIPAPMRAGTINFGTANDLQASTAGSPVWVHIDI